MNNFDCIVSLGYNCYPCMYAEKKDGKIKKEYFFDDIATPAWAIKELLENNFNGFFDKAEYEKIKLFDRSSYEFLTNKKYYIRFSQFFQISKLDSLLNLFQKKKTNFMNKLQSEQKILFIRNEEPIVSDIPKLSGNRIIYDEYASRYQHKELYHLAILSTYLQTTYPNLNFHIMFIANDLNQPIQLNYDSVSKIFTIPNKIITTANYEQVIDQIFIDHETFINDSLKL